MTKVELEKARVSSAAYRAANLEKRLVQERKAYRVRCLKHPKEARIKRLKRYGLTLKSFDDLLASQGGVCAVCSSADWGKTGPVVDHCHITGKVRGILCSKHNRALGLLGDDFRLMEAATAYLKKDIA